MGYKGWYQVAFERDLTAEISPARVGDRRLVLVRREGAIRAFDAGCPHRGADLAMGALADDAVVCAFHGYRIGLGLRAGCDHGLRVHEHPCVSAGGLVFVRVSDDHDNGFVEWLTAHLRGRSVAPGFVMPVRAPAALVSENGFDGAHFRAVHDVLNEVELAVCPSAGGELGAEGVFEIPATAEQSVRLGVRLLRLPYAAYAFSPGLVVSDLGGESPYGVVTGATPAPGGGTAIHLSLTLPEGSGAERAIPYLLSQSRAGLERDWAIWESLVPPARPHFTHRDAAVIAFHAFCRRFEGD